MLKETRAMYYPQTTLLVGSTRFGMPIAEGCQIYEQPVRGKRIVKFDILKCLSSCWGSNITQGREQVWILVSGDGVEDEEYKEILISCYKRFAAFANFCDECYYFGDLRVNLHQRFLDSVKEKIQEIRNEILSYGGRLLAEDHGYMYVAFDTTTDTANMKGVSAIYG